ncbi:hypothetical protein FACS189437_03560 [Bacteroidia bacterium]|nr:hypothetical protein FACS189437_03560 [Bacteroidia bacterium]
MNKSIIYSILFGAILFFAACDPIENREEMTGHVTEDQLDVSATLIVVDGIQSNKIILENHSPVLSNWYVVTDPVKGARNLLSVRAQDEVLLTSVGENTILFEGRNGDGSTVTKTIKVTVDDIVFKIPGLELFIGNENSKTWVWDEFTDQGTPWGIGGAINDKAVSWWGPGYGNFTESDATMTFALDGGLVFTKTLGDGTKEIGSFKYDLNYRIKNKDDGKESSWVVGKITFKGATVPHPQSANYPTNASKPDAYEFYILVLDEEQIILATLPDNVLADEVGAGGEANFWLFRPEGFELAPNDEQIAALTGGSSKVWSWASGAVFGNGGATGSGPAWWTMDAAAVNDQKPGEGAGATMTFNIDGTMLLTKNDGATIDQTYKVNMGKFIEGYSIGTLTVSDHVLAGYSPNDEANGKPWVQDYNILVCDDNSLVLQYEWSGEAGTGWFWVFAPVQ